jgi:hypothetical protein
MGRSFSLSPEGREGRRVYHTPFDARHSRVLAQRQLYVSVERGDKGVGRVGLRDFPTVGADQLQGLVKAGEVHCRQYDQRIIALR